MSALMHFPVAQAQTSPPAALLSIVSGANTLSLPDHRNGHPNLAAGRATYPCRNTKKYLIQQNDLFLLMALKVPALWRHDG